MCELMLCDGNRSVDGHFRRCFTASCSFSQCAVMTGFSELFRMMVPVVWCQWWFVRSGSGICQVFSRAVLI